MLFVSEGLLNLSVVSFRRKNVYPTNVIAVIDEMVVLFRADDFDKKMYCVSSIDAAKDEVKSFATDIKILRGAISVTSRASYFCLHSWRNPCGESELPAWSGHERLGGANMLVHTRPQVRVEVCVLVRLWILSLVWSTLPCWRTRFGYFHDRHGFERSAKSCPLDLVIRCGLWNGPWILCF